MVGLERSERVLLAAVVATAALLASAGAYVVGHPDEGELQALFDNGMSGPSAFRYTEYVTNSTMSRVNGIFESDPRQDEERLQQHTFTKRPDGSPASAYTETHRKGIYVVEKRPDGDPRLRRSYDSRSINPWNHKIVANATWSSAEVRNDDGTLLGNITLDGLHRIARIDLANPNPKDPAAARFQVFEYGPVSFPAFAVPTERGPIRVSADVNNTPGILHVADLVADSAVPPEELSFRFLGPNMTLIHEVPFEDTLQERHFVFKWIDWNHNGWVDSGDAIEHRLAPPAELGWIYDEWAGSYAEDLPSGSVTMVVSLLLAAAWIRRRAI